MERNERADFTIEVGYDREAEVWVVEQSEVPGLTIEGDTYDQLITKIHDLAPVLLRANEVGRAATEVSLDIFSRYRDRVRIG
jgi:hypothetical protein